MGTIPRTPPGPRPGGASPGDPAIRLIDVHVGYGRTIALRDIDLEIAAGSTVAAIGPNGSGKSTLLATISGLVRPTRGRVEIGGARGRRRGAVAHVLQATVANSSVPLTVRETVRMGCYARRGPLAPLTTEDRASVDEAIARLRIEDLVDRQLHELSGGQRQRVYVAQGLAQRADVLLLDEPITGLDLVTQETVGEVVAQERAAGRTVVLTTHDVGTAGLADVAVLMATGVIATGEPADVLTPENLSRAYGGHVHVLRDGTVVLDESHHHDHRHDDQLRS